MYENDIIEMEDFSFNRLVHHFNESDGEIHYNEEYQCLDVVTECMEEYVYEKKSRYKKELSFGEHF